MEHLPPQRSRCAEAWTELSQTVLAAEKIVAGLPLADSLPDGWAGRIKAPPLGLSLVISISLLVMWLDPSGVAKHGFDAKAYAAEETA